ncbi:MAG: TetR family transcriptional regulator [Pseudonocardia sp.]|nr:TetR family transcriptional regulator [Pseudonocardia sp.]
MSRGERTRRRILDAAGALLASRPGAVPSMSEVASGAGVSRQLLYVHFENRTALLLELSRLIDLQARTPELQATIDNAPDARAALRAAVRVQSVIKPKLHGVAASLELLRPVDEGAAAACQEREDARLMRCRAVIERLADERLLAPGWTTAEAAELFWSMTSLRAWEDLTCRAGWTNREWSQRTTDALEAALVAGVDEPQRQRTTGSADSRSNLGSRPVSQG